jgi:hypothetical protein
VRIRIGEYAYEVTEVTKAVGAARAAFERWVFTIYKGTPPEELVTGGENSSSRDHAERNALQLIELYADLDRQKQKRSNNACN